MKLPLKEYYDLLARYLRPQWRQVTWLALALFGGITLQLLIPQLLRLFIDSAQAGLVAQLLPIGILYLVVGLINQAMRTGAAYLTEDVKWRATNWLRNDLSRHCLQLDMAFHNENTPGTMIERLDSDVADLSAFFSQFVLQVLGNSILLAGVLVLLYLEDWRIGAAYTLVAIIMLSVWGKTVGVGAPLWVERLAANANLSGQLEEWLNSTEDIRANGIISYINQQFMLAHYKIYIATRKAIVVGLTWAFSTMVFDVSLALVLALGVYLWQRNIVTVGTLFMLFQYGKLIQNPLEELARQSQELQGATASIVRIRELFDTQPLVQNATKPETLSHTVSHTGLTVEFQDVTFGYKRDELVLRKISFSLESGQVLGLLGRTGSGKTSITRLLLRLYDPTMGTIRLSGVDTRLVALDDLRDRIGIVTQDVQLFRASVRDNLTLFNKSVPDQQILDSIELLGLGDWLSRLDQGLDTPLAGGQGLSAGEAQLLAFTRVFLKNPGLIIMDEASSRLDPITEQLIEHAIDRLLYNRTAIIVAHRLATVQRADRIMILRDGQILEAGERVALVADPSSHFSHLLRIGIEEVLG